MLVLIYGVYGAVFPVDRDLELKRLSELEIIWKNPGISLKAKGKNPANNSAMNQIQYHYHSTLFLFTIGGHKDGG